MAHLFDQSGPIYLHGKKVSTQNRFPKTPFFSGFNIPSRIEGDVHHLEVDGKIPEEIAGTFYRIQPDHRYPPIYEEDIHFNGDGNITAIRIEDGHADFKQRYVHTDRFVAETKARQNLFGKYRNPYTDSESVKGIIRTAANTNIIFWRGVLLATKEDGPPYAMDPTTLETIGRYDFDSQITAPTFTAHPKFDWDTGEMICFAYEAGGDGNDGSCDVAVWTIDGDGKKTEECWYKAPFCGMIHDCAITKNYVVLPMTPLKCSTDRLRNGGNHWAWDPDEDQLYGLVPRRNGKPSDIVWFRAPNAFHGHVAGAYEKDDGQVVIDIVVASGNVFFFFPPDPNIIRPSTKNVGERNKLSSPTTRWVLDPKAPTDSRIRPFRVFDSSGEFPRIDDRFTAKYYTQFWQLIIDPSKPYDSQACGSPAGGLFNCLGHFNWETNERDVWFAGPTSTLQEPVFIPYKDSSEEGVGYIVALVNRLDELRNDIAIFDAQKVQNGPIAVIRLPFKLRLGLHGNWVDKRDIEEFARRRASGGDLGPVQPAQVPLPWQEKLHKSYDATSANVSNRFNGHNGVA